MNSVGSLTEVREAGLDRADLLTIYRNMLVTRGVEERGHILYKQGKIPGSFYTGRGNEAAAVGVATAMHPDDVGAPPDLGGHRSRVAGAGPQLGWHFQASKVAVDVNLRGYAEFASQNRPEGWNAWLSVTFSSAPDRSKIN